MKYLRKIIALLIGVVFFAAIVISLGIIFAVKNVNVTMVTYADDYTDSFNKAKSSLEVFKGDSLIFLNEKEVADIVKDSNYTLVSCEKVYPCTVNITLKERLEIFSVSVGGLYSMYDSDGRYLRSSITNENINDGTPNVELKGVAVEKITDIASIASKFKETFNCLRSVVSDISLDTNPDILDYTDKLYFNLRCGLKIRLDNYKVDTDEKIEAAYAKFCTLTDRQKLSGTLTSYRIGGDDGIINADYTNLF